MNRGFITSIVVAVALGTSLLSVCASTSFAGPQVLHGHVPPIVARLAALGRLPSTNQLHLAIGLPLRNTDALAALLQELYDPASPNFRHYLTPDEFAEKFGPTPQDYQAVIAFARANGLKVTTTHPNRMLLSVEGAVGDIEKTFHVTMRVYQHPTEARRFYAPDVEPAVDLAVPVVDVSGLSNYSRPHPNYVARKLPVQAPAVMPNTGSGSSGLYMGNDFRAAYVPGTTLTGAGQTIALVQFDGYLASDIASYESQAGLPSVTLSNVLLDSFSGTPTGNGGEVEVSLDIEMVISMAPGLSKVIVYEGNPSDFIPNDVLNRITTDNAARQISCSWGWSGGPSTTTDQIFQQMATQGQTLFIASGDSDSYKNGAVDSSSLFGYPSQSPYITSVGGTMLTTTGPGGSFTSETVWNTRTWDSSRGAYVGSSGGISTYYSIPSWQQGMSMTNNGGSTANRNFPDVALTATNIYVIADNGTHYATSGTSCAAPLWAGFTALVNQQGSANGLSPVGFLNPALYTIGKGATYTADFHDTTTGDNTSPDLQNTNGSTNQFYAVAGYDLCTGWGSPNGTNLINALAPVIANIVAAGNTLLAESCTPTNGVIDSGETVTVNFTLQNIGSLSTSNLVATLLATNGVSAPSGPQFYGALAGSGGTAASAFTFTATNVCGAVITPTLQLQDGTTNLGTVTFTFRLGQALLSTPLVQNFDAITAPSLPAGWTTTNSGAQALWVTTTGANDTAPNSAFTAGASAIGVNELVSPSFSINATNAQLRFRHSYNLQSSRDGGVLEIKINTNAFTDFVTAGGSFSSGGYVRTLSTTRGNPLGGRSAWSGNSGGFITTLANLPTNAAGKAVQLKWRCGTDNSTSSAGWYIDSITITDNTYVCCVPPPPVDLAVYNSPTPNVVVAGTPLTFNLSVFNFGPGNATSVVISDTLPASVTFVSATSSQGTWTNFASSVIFNLSSLATGITATASIQVTPANALTQTALLTNAAVVSASQLDTNTANIAITTITLYTDSVGDHIPDWWRAQFFGSSGTNTNALSCASCDPDGDGQSNFAEYLAGTNPMNSQSVFRIDTFTPSGNDMLLTFNSVSGKTYAVDWNADLTVTNGWSSLTNNIPGTGAPIQVTDPGALAHPARFYRLRLLP